MTRAISRNGVVLLAVTLAVSFLVPLGQAAAASSVSSASSHPSKRERIRILTAALKKMRKDYRQLASSPGPPDIFDYQIGDLWKQGIDGTGTTIAVIEGWDDPHINSIVRGFDKPLGLPNPQITTIIPSDHHKLPAKCPPGMVKLGSYGSCDAWMGELELDVLTAHLIAPYAKIIISVTPADSEITDDPASNVAPPEMMLALEYISRRHLANVISISDGTGESTYSHGRPELIAQNPGELAAAAAGIPVLVGTGDCNAAQNLAVANAQCGNTTKGRATAAWDDSPWVTAVGGTVPNLNSAGQRIGPDPVWNIGQFGEGAGLSAVFARPGYQDGVRSITRSAMRSVPDITMDAQDGTSESTPMLAGVLALATQLNRGRNVGPINSVLYGVLGPRGIKAGIADVVRGNNSVVAGGKVKIRGFTAARGFDVASGWGTIRANRFVPSLVAATRARHQDRSVRQRAATELRRLEHQVRLTRVNIGAGQTARVSAGGLIPLHPATLFIDGRKITILHASTRGSVSYVIDPAAIGLPAGQHTLRLVSMLLTATKGFRSS
jgi:subtilase family serine protease